MLGRAFSNLQRQELKRRLVHDQSAIVGRHATVPLPRQQRSDTRSHPGRWLHRQRPDACYQFRRNLSGILRNAKCPPPSKATDSLPGALILGVYAPAGGTSHHGNWMTLSRSQENICLPKPHGVRRQDSVAASTSVN